MTLSPQEQLKSLANETSGVTEEQVAKLFDQLDAVEPEFMFGEWGGGSFETGHQTCKWVKDVKFAGKTFHSATDVDPVWVFNDKGNRTFYEPSGHARLREIKFRGVVTTALIYDSAPIIDYFRKVDENMVVAAADNKNKPDGTFFFYLTRSKK